MVYHHHTITCRTDVLLLVLEYCFLMMDNIIRIDLAFFGIWIIQWHIILCTSHLQITGSMFIKVYQILLDELIFTINSASLDKVSSV